LSPPGLDSLPLNSLLLYPRLFRIGIFRFQNYLLPLWQHHAKLASPSGELPIIEASLDLIRWFVPLLQRLPRQHKFGLGDRLIANLYHLLEQLVHARYARAKLPILEPLKAHIVVIQLQIRLLHQFKLIEIQRYEHASRLITTIAKQHSGWLGQQQRQPA